MVNMRKVVVKDITYVRLQDVDEYIREFAATEETDVRDRLLCAADLLSKLSEPAGPILAEDTTRAGAERYRDWHETYHETATKVIERDGKFFVVYAD